MRLGKRATRIGGPMSTNQYPGDMINKEGAQVSEERVKELPGAPWHPAYIEQLLRDEGFTRVITGEGSFFLDDRGRLMIEQ